MTPLYMPESVFLKIAKDDRAKDVKISDHIQGTFLNPEKVCCIHCGSRNVSPAGARIICRDCNRTSAKVKRCHVVPKAKRPPCPECGTPEPYSWGTALSGYRRYICRKCGKNYEDRPLIKDQEYSKKVIDEMDTLEVQVE